ncbi:TIGR03915 family putative DNA repair protein [Flaviaesturariibacter amylovorans]|uniref:TIGR03915 family putative DNA repair protein n=1 Tax=Flaviaesturariibacter amylovorans TaxID=1084520 RepID=A0ABP8GJZ3_9BACT
MLQTVLYDGSFDGWLCAVFDVYDYKFGNAEIVTEARFRGNLFGAAHTVRNDARHSARVWKGLEAKLSGDALKDVYRTFLSEADGAETVLLQYVQHVFAHTTSVETDFSHPAVLYVTQMGRKVWREQHRMEAFVRFQRTGDGLYYGFIEPDHDVLPLIAPHFTSRYADQRWLIYDGRRRYGLYYDGERTETVELRFDEAVGGGRAASPVYDPSEELYQQAWKQYFKSVNIPARKNSKLHLQHLPRRYWKYLTEKQG